MRTTACVALLLALAAGCEDNHPSGSTDAPALDGPGDDQDAPAGDGPIVFWDAPTCDAPVGPLPDAATGDGPTDPGGCGDGYCDRDEDCFTCEADCGACPAGCGDGVCEPALGEDCTLCPMDCTCGDATCQEAMDCARGCAGDATCVLNCAQSACYESAPATAALLACLATSCASQCADLSSTGCLLCTLGYCGGEAATCYGAGCGVTTCEDGTCQPEEDCVICPADCGACPDLCGDGACQPAEACDTCPDDCGPCCGNGVCAPDEDCTTCAADCGDCPLLCGDGFCEPFLGETCMNCPDCTCGGDTCGQVLNCFYGCTDLLCPNTCLNTGCAAAQAQMNALLTCAATSCLMSCLNPSDPACATCLGTSCGDELMACVLGFC